MDVATVFGAIACEPLELEYLLPVCHRFGPAEVYDGVTEARRYGDVLRAFRPDAVGLTGYLTQEREMVDYVFRSESAGDFGRLLSALERGEKPKGIPGLCRREGVAFSETPYEPPDIDALPMPDRSGWEARADWFRYLDFPRLSTLKTAVFCPFPCDLCYGRNLHGGRYQARRLDLVLGELEETPGENVFIVDPDDGLEERNTPGDKFSW